MTRWKDVFITCILLSQLILLTTSVSTLQDDDDAGYSGSGDVGAVSETKHSIDSMIFAGSVDDDDSWSTVDKMDNKMSKGTHSNREELYIEESTTISYLSPKWESMTTEDITTEDPTMSAVSTAGESSDEINATVEPDVATVGDSTTGVASTLSDENTDKSTEGIRNYVIDLSDGEQVTTITEEKLEYSFNENGTDAEIVTMFMTEKPDILDVDFVTTSTTEKQLATATTAAALTASSSSTASNRATTKKDSSRPYWYLSNWFQCSAACGGGKQYRLVFCARDTNSTALPIDEEECDPAQRHKSVRHCNTESCPTWQTTEWTKCSSICGEGTSYRKVACRDSSGKLRPESHCGKNEPKNSNVCLRKPCKGSEWIVSPWSECNGACGSMVRTRHVSCADSNGKTIPDEFCSVLRKPADHETCDKECKTEGIWFLSQWSECSMSCGEGLRTRQLSCLESQSNQKLPSSDCGPIPEEFSNTKEKCNIQDCTESQWFTAPWSSCKYTSLSSYLVKTRETFCLLPGGKPTQICDLDTEPDSVERCSDTFHTDYGKMHSECASSKFGCCPDGYTSAKGMLYSGCRSQSDAIGSCISSEFSCCLDGFTSALGPYLLGCPDTVTCKDTYFGCCGDGRTPAGGPNKEFCADNDDCFLTEFGCCEDGVTAAQGLGLAGCDTTTPHSKAKSLQENSKDRAELEAEGSGECVGDGCANAAETDIPCQVSEFGCCPDGVNHAQGYNEEGCPVVELCHMPPVTGPCFAAKQRYFYNSVSDSCEQFIYGGCGGNLNRFNTIKECREACQSANLTDGDAAVTVEAGSNVEVMCQLPQENHILSWKFTSEDGVTRKLESGSGNGRIRTIQDNDLSILAISNIGMRDAGIYICEALLESTGQTVSTPLPIKVMESNITSDYTEETDTTTVVFDMITTDRMSTAVYTTPAYEYTTEQTVSTSAAVNSNCESARFGCCSDGVSYSEGPNYEGCPETRTPYTLADYPRDFTAVKDAESGRSVRLRLSWQPPAADSTVDMYTVYYTDDTNKPLTAWNTLDLRDSYASVIVSNEKPVFFKVRAFNRQEKSPISPTHVYNSSEGKSRQLIGGCYGTRFGCCDDGLTSANGAFKAGCPEQEVVTMAISVPADVTTASPERTTSASKSLLPPPKNFKIIRDAVASDRVSVELKWEDPVDEYPVTEYVLRFTSDRDLPQDLWRRFTVDEKSWRMALRRQILYYFTVAADIGGEETEQSAIYVYNPEEQMSRLHKSNCESSEHGCCQDGVTMARGPGRQGCSEMNCENARYGCCSDGSTAATGPNYEGCVRSPVVSGSCSSSKWGCCSDGSSSAFGPDRLGCSGDPQPCDVSQYGCCPDGNTVARGENFSGCRESLQSTEEWCTSSRYGCCPDGVTSATGPQNAGCPDLMKKAEACVMSSETGSCSDYVVHWYFDVTSGSCRRFWYGGCEGNDNRFTSKEACEEQCVSPQGKAACYLPSIAGRCRAFKSKWHFDAETQTCQEFKHGGCGGNNNKFDTEADCKRFCSSSTKPDSCSLPTAVQGPCRGKFQRWTYNQRSGRCEEFVYGGCYGNKNRFTTPEECHKTCVDRDAKEICLAPLSSGSCHSMTIRWHYDASYGKCRSFNYSGCGKNLNNFFTHLDCVLACDRLTLFARDICTLPQKTGPCHLLIPAWYYDQESGTCSQFYYGGCDGNQNRFSSQTECQQRCAHRSAVAKQDSCSLPAETGNCFARFLKYAYDPVQQRCVQFIYGGCGGNENRFDTPEECMKSCGSVPSLYNVDDCLLPTESGACAENIQRYAYSAADGKCKQFVYSGCPGNNNNFMTAESCERTCAPAYDDDDAMCKLPEDAGPCRGRYRRWKFDFKSGRCVLFAYGGCQGNGNNFLSEKDCLERCGTETVLPEEVCMLPMVVGPCRAAIPAYYYNPNSAKCELFTYGGCDGNANRFATEAACESKCAPKSTAVASQSKSVCSLSVDSGPCKAYMKHWFFNTEASRCEEFVYGGCRGNENNFRSLDECEKRCSIPKKDVCSLPSDQGLCLGSLPRWFFNSQAHRCEKFIYGGCQGNENRFMTEQACVNRCGGQTTANGQLNVCALSMDQASCEGQSGGQSREQWFYDRREGSCQSFTYSGCGGNDNRFNSLESCEQKCSAKDICRLPATTGLCRAAFPMYYFDPSAGECMRFTYGGCGGNANRFETEPMCQVACERTMIDSKPSVRSSTISDVCYLAKASGSCRGYDIKWYYDSVSQVCRRFVYSGCEGNANRFDDRDACQSLCKQQQTNEDRRRRPVTRPTVTRITETNLCEEPVAMGDCSNQMISYYFDTERQICREFLYSGCGGNRNRFDSISGCQARCMNSESISCSQPVCEQTCSSGYKMNRRGCQTCDCLDVCDNIRCPSGSRCVEQRTQCREFDQNCQPVTSVCAQISKEGICPSNEPRSCDLTSCNDDADCQGQHKCCSSPVCGSVCRPMLLSGDSPSSNASDCMDTAFGCCLDGVTAAADFRLSGCPGQAATISRPEGVGSQFIVAASTSVVLPCNAKGSPQPTIAWYHNRQPISVKNSERFTIGENGALTIQLVEKDDGGEYICRAYNGVGDSAYEYLTLTVQSGVIIQPSEIEFSVRRGTSVSLPCAAVGDPKPTITWMLDGQVVQYEDRVYAGEDNSLIINDVDGDDEGDYVCLAKNKLNTASKTLTLFIKEPMEVTLASHNRSYAIGETLELVCLADSWPPAKIEWLRNDEVLPYSKNIVIDGVTLEITNLKESDSGYYTCTASNKLEAQTVTTSITVKSNKKPMIPASCQDLPKLANCALIVRHNFCHHKYYKKFCCKSCVMSGKLTLH